MVDVSFIASFVIFSAALKSSKCFLYDTAMGTRSPRIMCVVNYVFPSNAREESQAWNTDLQLLRNSFSFRELGSKESLLLVAQPFSQQLLTERKR